MINYSIIRLAEYENLSKISLDGHILDVGGSKKSGYHSKISGKNNFTVVNIDSKCEPDLIVDVEKKFPFDDESFDHSICLNVIEHLFEFENAFSEQVRCIKKGGKIVIAAPFMHFIHGSPDDYLRYTASSYRKLAEKYGVQVELLEPLGTGLFALNFQLIGGFLPTNFLRQIFRQLATGLDTLLNRISKRYRTLSARIPLGYFVIFVK